MDAELLPSRYRFFEMQENRPLDAQVIYNRPENGRVVLVN